jgi:hypothetical protein
MKQQMSTREAVDKSPAAPTKATRHDPFGARTTEYPLRVSYYATMKPQRIYPLVIEVLPGRSPSADGAAGVMVTLRPAVAGALVVPPELPLDVSRPGSHASFHVTPLARGRLPEACVRIFQDGRQVQEIRTRMTVKTQRMTWVLLFAIVLLPWFLSYWCRTNPLRGVVPINQPLAAAQFDGADDGPKPAAGQKPAEKPVDGRKPRGGGGGATAPVPPDQAILDRMQKASEMEGTPGEVLGCRMKTYLDDELPDVEFKGPFIEKVSRVARRAYDEMHFWVPHLYIPWWSCLAFIFLTFASWVMHRPTRVRLTRAVALGH